MKGWVLFYLVILAGLFFGCGPDVEIAESQHVIETECGPCGENSTPCGADGLGLWRGCVCQYRCPIDADGQQCEYKATGEACAHPCAEHPCPWHWK